MPDDAAKQDLIERKRLLAAGSRVMFTIIAGGTLHRKGRSLAKFFGVDEGTVRGMLNGESIPETDTLDKIQAKTGLSHLAILGREPLPEEFHARFASKGELTHGEPEMVSRQSLTEAKAILDQIEAIRVRQLKLIQDLEAENAKELQEAAKPRRPLIPARTKKISS